MFFCYFDCVRFKFSEFRSNIDILNKINIIFRLWIVFFLKLANSFIDMNSIQIHRLDTDAF